MAATGPGSLGVISTIRRSPAQGWQALTPYEDAA